MLFRSVGANNDIADLREQKEEPVNQKFKNRITLIKPKMLCMCCINMALILIGVTMPRLMNGIL